MNNISYITSSSNDKIKFIKSLHRKKSRDKEGLFIVEGLKIIEECLDNNYNLETLVMSNNFFEDADNANFINNLFNKNIGTEILYVDDRVFGEITDTETPQGILGISKLLVRELSEFKLKKDGFYLILDEVQDPGNMGTIIRTADAFGVDGIFISGGSVDIYNSKVVRATMGSIYRTPIYKVDKFKKLKDILESLDINIYSSSLKGKDNLDKINFKNSMFIIGNESKGVSEEYQSLATELIKIPMVGEAESLNAAIASSIIMYEAMVNRKL